MTIKYSNLPEIIKEKLNWSGLQEKIIYSPETDLGSLIYDVLLVLNGYFPEMQISERGVGFRFNIEHPEGDKGEIEVDGMSVSDLVILMNSEIYRGITFSKKFDASDFITFRYRKGDQEAEVVIREERTSGFPSDDYSVITLSIKPNSQENTYVFNQIKKELTERAD